MKAIPTVTFGGVKKQAANRSAGFFTGAVPPIRGRMEGGQLVTDVLRVVPKVWGHYAVEGSWKPGSMFGNVASTISGAILQGVKSGSPEKIIEALAQSAARTIMANFEREIKRATIAAYQEGFKAGVAEGIARERAAIAAAKEAAESGIEAATIFPKLRHAQAKEDYAEAERLAHSLQAYHGTKAANVEPDAEEEIPMQPVTSISGWVEGAGLHQGRLAIQFKGSVASGPVVCVYPGSGKAALQDLLAATSAGKWVWSHVYHASYTKA